MSNQNAHPIAERLRRMNLMVSAAVVLIATAAFFSVDLVSFRRDIIRHVQAEAQMIGDNSTSALVFNDPQSAANTLASLRRSREVYGAVLETPQNSLFASYTAGSSLSELERAQYRLTRDKDDQVWQSLGHVVVVHRISLQGNTVGTVLIGASLHEIGARAERYLFISMGILLFCMAAGIVISTASRRLIAQPISQLADTAHSISRDQDYSVRAKVHPEALEIEVLTDAFNTMLDQISERDLALSLARDELESRVKRRTAQLEAANRELEAFSYTVAHDLRGPLDSIGNLTVLLRDACEQRSPESIPPLLEYLNASVTNMTALIDDLLNFARASTAQIRQTPVNLTDIVREITDALRASAPERNVEFTIQKVPEVIGDPGLLRVVMDNLLRNAWKYTSHHATARIEFGQWRGSTGNGAKGPVFFVKDDGAGFDSAKASLLFRPFQRLHEPWQFTGTGIGLATVQRILSKQGGTIWAEAAVEEGATFLFTIGVDSRVETPQSL